MATLAARLGLLITAIGDQFKDVYTKVLPTGGTTGQILAKSSNTDYAVGWITPASGGVVTDFQTLDFGSTPVTGLTFVFTVTGAAPGNKVIMVPTGSANADELEMDLLVCAAYVSNTNEVTATVAAFPGPIIGERNFSLMIG